MDMLSNLPDPILCHILSFVPTKTSVACSLLSKRWKLLWTCVPVIDLDVHRDMQERYVDHEEYANYNEYEKKKKEEKEERELRFVRIVDNVSFLPREFPIKILRLSMNESSESMNHVHKWMKACRFEELDLSLRYQDFTFPKSFHYNNMVVLKLNVSRLGSVDSGLFPKLKVLHLLWVSFKDKHGASLENFLSACPILEELLCEQLCTYDKRALRICVPTLTSLVLHCHEYYGFHRRGAEFVLETPALEDLSFKHDPTEDSIVTRTSLCNLSRLHITCLFLTDDRPYGSSLMELLKNLSGVQVLKLSFEEMSYDPDKWFSPWRGLADKFDYSCLDDLPVFHNLVRLELSIPSCDCVLLPRLLQKFPNLRHISINKVFDIKEAEVCWEEPLLVPICLSSTLLSFCFQGFEGFEVEMELVKYVTKHAKVLKNFTVEASSSFKILQARVEAVHELPKVTSRVSEACQFSWFEN